MLFCYSLDTRGSKDEFVDDQVDEYHIKAGRLISLDPKSPNPTCFSASLMVGNTDIVDKRDYTIVVKNALGSAEGVATLKVCWLISFEKQKLMYSFQVYSPLSGATLVTIALIILVLLFLLTVVAVFILRRRASSSSSATLNKGTTVDSGSNGQDQEKSDQIQGKQVV